MNTNHDTILEEMKQAIDDWFACIRATDAEAIVKRTTLQAGLHDYALLEYTDGRASVTDIPLDFPSSDRMGGYGETVGELTEDEVRKQFIPQLAAYVREKLDSLSSTALIDYRFTFAGKFAHKEGEVDLPILVYVDDRKREQLLQAICAYIQTRLDTGNHPTKPLETFFLSRHLLDDGLFPELEPQRIISLFDRILELNRGNRERLAEHSGYIGRALQDWVEETFLPRYFERQQTPWRSSEYTKKIGVSLEDDKEGQIDLLLYTAVWILRYEPSYMRTKGIGFLERAVELGNKKASRFMKEGSGVLPVELASRRDELVECQANDVFATVTIVIKQEAEESYRRALRFLVNLLKQGFPKSYMIQLKSGAKQFLPVKGLAKSGTHRFFANALAYPNLYPLLEEYAREAMEPFEWYGDAEGEKNCMPGTYAVFGLGLADRHYFPLVEAYMGMVDEEHQSVQDQFTTAFLEKYGVSAETVSALVTCMRHCSDSWRPKMKTAWESEESIGLLLAQVRGRESHEVQRLLELIWGGVDKLAAAAAKAKGVKGGLLSELVEAAGNRQSRRRLPG